MNVALRLLVGAVIGVLVGITGTGGTFVIPALISALPIWFLAFIPYAQGRNFDLRLGLLIAAGICLGSYFGASWAQYLPVLALRRVLGSVLVPIGARLPLHG